jgi:hypothetical protein
MPKNRLERISGNAKSQNTLLFSRRLTLMVVFTVVHTITPPMPRCVEPIPD